MEKTIEKSSDGHKTLLLIMGPIVLILVLMVILVFSTRDPKDEVKDSSANQHSNY